MSIKVRCTYTIHVASRLDDLSAEFLSVIVPNAPKVKLKEFTKMIIAAALDNCAFSPFA